MDEMDKVFGNGGNTNGDGNGNGNNYGNENDVCVAICKIMRHCVNSGEDCVECVLKHMRSVVNSILNKEVQDLYKELGERGQQLLTFMTRYLLKSEAKKLCEAYYQLYQIKNPKEKEVS